MTKAMAKSMGQAIEVAFALHDLKRVGAWAASEPRNVNADIAMVKAAFLLVSLWDPSIPFPEVTNKVPVLRRKDTKTDGAAKEEK